jgi:hypothetical protein
MKITRLLRHTNPEFFDKIIGSVQLSMMSNFEWLDHIFGQSQKLVKKKGNKEVTYPAVHVENGKYVSVLPDAGLGNFCFFILHDPEIVDFNPHEANTVKAKYSLIFWVNLDKIYSSEPNRNTEILKASVLKFLTRKLFLRDGRLTVESIETEAKNVYKGYSLKEVESQYLMQPYAGVRINGELTLIEGC